MCECKNGTFQVIEKKLMIWDEEYHGYYLAPDEDYLSCPICVTYLHEMKTPKAQGSYSIEVFY